MHLLALGCGVVAALSYGVADYSGGVATMRLPGPVVVASSQLRGLVIVLVLVLGVRQPISVTSSLLGAAVGVLSCVSLSVLFKALSYGSSVTVAPLAAVVGAIVAVAAGSMRYGGLNSWALSGSMCTLASILLMYRGSMRLAADLPWHRRALAMTVVAGLASGFAMMLLMSVSSNGLLWALLSERVVTVVVLVMWSRRLGPPLLECTALSRLLWLVGLGYLMATSAFAIGAGTGAAVITAVAASQYPLVTVLTAVGMGKESLTRSQGVGLCLAGVGLAVIAVS